jgi:uncharacterized cupredoxin-like copper-binding protein
MTIKIIKPTVALITILLLATGKLTAQNHAAAMANADTVKFSVNQSGGWGIFNSHLMPIGADSAKLEIIVQHDRAVNWQQEQYMGKIKDGNLKPQSQRYITWFLLTDKYEVHILQNGKCYIRLVTGYLPGGNPVVFPINLKYKL